MYNRDTSLRESLGVEELSWAVLVIDSIYATSELPSTRHFVHISGKYPVDETQQNSSLPASALSPRAKRWAARCRDSPRWLIVIDDVLAQFPGVKKTANGWQTKCPAHDDKVASLSISVQEDGKVLLYCHAGCELRDILRAAGLKMTDLFPATTQEHHRAPGRSIVATYDYTDPEGKLEYQVVRFQPKGFSQRRREETVNGSEWVWNLKGVTRYLFRLPQVTAAVAQKLTIFIVEGEKDVLTLEEMGLTATCNAGGAGKWFKPYSQQLAGADVVILPDNDLPGKGHAELVALSLNGLASRVRVVELPDLPPKGDVTDWVRAGGTAEELSEIVNSARNWRAREDPDAPMGIDGHYLHDVGNARRLIAAHGESIHYVCDRGRWYVWDGRHWAEDQTGEVLRMAKGVVDSMLDFAGEARRKARTNGDKEALAAAKQFEKHALASGNHGRIVAMLTQAQSEPGVPVLYSDMDSDPWLFNCANGTIDLCSGELKRHCRDDMITKLSPVEFDARCPCPTWEKFLADIFKQDDELVNFAQAASGYTLTGDTREQVFFILHGSGSNGKSTFVNVLRDLFGDYGRKTSTDAILEKQAGSASNDVARLRGARFVSAIETSAGKRLAEALVKELTGQDAITARFLYQEYFEFVPVFKLWLACNHVPVIHGQEKGMWRRIRLIPFLVEFHDTDSPEGPYKDNMLPDRLKTEYPGILAWVLRGCLDWQTNGLPAAVAVKAATGKLQQDMDILGGFVSECCIFDSRAEVPAKDLYQAYCEWAELAGEKPLSQRWFGLRLGERSNCETYKGPRGYKWWRGIGLLDRSHDSAVDHEDLAEQGTESPSCARENGSSHDDASCMRNSQNLAPHGPQGPHGGSDESKDGIDWSDGEAF
jgi:putative DNA primase/helicase